jgi:transposase
MDLTDAQWTALAPLLPKPRVRRDRRDRRGRPWRDPRDVVNGILWVLRTGAPWKDLPARYPSYQTCHRRFQFWVESGTMEKVLRALARDLEARGQLDLSECVIDGPFAGAQQGAPSSGKPSGARGPRSWPLQTALVFLSAYPSAVLRRMKSPSSTPRSITSSPTRRRPA